MKRRFWPGAIAMSICGMLLTGCALQPAPTNHMMTQESSKFSSSDIMFAQMMIPHHQQAVDMGTLAETRALNPEVKALAAQIKGEQAPEINQMKGWLTVAGADLEMGHDMGMDGLLTDSEFDALKDSAGSVFDKLYLQGMIGHHEGAIAMAKLVENSQNAEVKALGQAIVTSQTKQINYMKALLKTLG